MKKRRFIALFIALAVAPLLSLSVSFAWFISITNILANEEETALDGSILRSYFDEESGNGTTSGPFIITRPKHWENLIYLHNNQPNFYRALQESGDTGFKFEIGKLMNDGTNIKKVYKYDNDGYVLKDSSGNELTDTTLNLAFYGTQSNGLIPLGSPRYPFISELEGNNITISNFKVLSVDIYNENHPLEDIGIFGYVGENGSCKNVYFNNYEIDTSGANMSPTEDDSLEHTSHSNTIRLGTDNNYPLVGYIAGHVSNANSFVHTYVNNCKINGNCSNYAQTTNYSYYGAVETFTENPSGNTGQDYSFTLDSSAIYSYFSNNHSNIEDNPLRARNTEYVNDLVNAGYSKNSNGNFEATMPFSDGVSYVTSGANTYNLQGKDPDSAYYGLYNYSLSTIGYATTDPTTADKNYWVKVKGTDGTLSELPSDMTRSDMTLEQLKAYRTSDNTEKRTKGNFYAYNDSTKTYEFYYADITDRGHIPIKIHITASGSHNFGVNLTQEPDLQQSTLKCALFVDNQKYIVSEEATGYSNINLSSTHVPRSVSHWVETWENPTLSYNYDNTYDLSLSPGTHKLGVLLWGHFSNTQLNTFASYYGSSYDFGVSYLTIHQNDFTIDASTPKNKVFDINVNNSSTMHHSSYGQYTNDWVRGNPQTAFEERSRLVQYGTYSYNNAETMVGIDDNGNEVPLSSNAYEFQYLPATYKTINGDPILYDEDVYVDGVLVFHAGDQQIDENGEPLFEQVQVVDVPAHWNAHISGSPSTLKDDNGNEVITYVSDDSGIVNSGYNSENIDVVGGGFRFSSNYITIDGEDDEAFVNKFNNNSIGSQWYATKYGPNSIPLKLTNVGGISENGEMGTIEFNYSWTVSNLLNTEFKSMCFKKGGDANNGGYVYFEDVCSSEDYSSQEGDNFFQRTVTMTLRRNAVKKAAYCALDKNGKILCGFDNDGNPSTSVSEKNIAYYILLVGVKNSRTFNILGRTFSINTRVSRIDFEYKARGLGGDFGTVEYRSSPSQVSGTIFNISFLCPKNDKFLTYVSYVDSNKKYVIYVFYNSNANSSISVNFFLYDLEYDIELHYYDTSQNKIVSTSVCETDGAETIDIVSSSTSSWSTP